MPRGGAALRHNISAIVKGRRRHSFFLAVIKLAARSYDTTLNATPKTALRGAGGLSNGQGMRPATYTIAHANEYYPRLRQRRFKKHFVRSRPRKFSMGAPHWRSHGRNFTSRVFLAHCSLQAMPLTPSATISSRLRDRPRRYVNGEHVWGYELADVDLNGPRYLGRVGRYDNSRGYEVFWVRCAGHVVDWYPPRALEPLCFPDIGSLVWCYADNDYNHAGVSELCEVLEVDGPDVSDAFLKVYFVHEYPGCDYVHRRTLEHAATPGTNNSLGSHRLTTNPCV